MNTEILKAAEEEFQVSGLKFTMTDVAKKMHISKKTIYLYYTSKEELLMDMLKTGFDDIQNNKKKILKKEIPLEKKIREIMIALPDQYQVIDLRMLSDLHQKYPKVYKALRTYLESDWEPVIHLLEEGMKAKKVRRISIPALQTIITATIESYLSTDVLKNSRMSYTEGLDAMMDIVMDGLLTKEAQ